MAEHIYTVEIYSDSQGRQPFVAWVTSLKDIRMRAQINVRLARLRLGNVGDCKALGDGIYELRVDKGPGYRIYFAYTDQQRLILLGGSKKTQPQDTVKAREYLKDYQRRKS